MLFCGKFGQLKSGEVSTAAQAKIERQSIRMLLEANYRVNEVVEEYYMNNHRT